MSNREASTHWTGGLQDGSGHVTMDSSKIGEYDVSLPKRAADDAGGSTSPEELVAAALSSCLAMNMSGVLGGEGLTADSIDVTASASFGPDPAGCYAVTGIKLEMRASIPGLEEDRFQELAAKAEQTCPVRKALAGKEISFTAKLA
ncbi:OsmC family peroxiredoxin [soil metagenome]